jgi:hypothetical protein
VSTTITTSSAQLPFDIADLYLLSPESAKATLERFEWLRDFAMATPGTARPEEGRLLLQAIDALQEIVKV